MAAPERFAEKSDLLLQRGHRPYMAHSDAPPQHGRALLSAQSGNGAIITPMRRFPPPWTIEDNNACFIVRDNNGQALGYF